MKMEYLFELHLVLGYVAWLLVFSAYILPKFRTMKRFDVLRAIAALHSFRFFGLVFLIPGIVGPHVPVGFSVLAAWGDFSAGVLAMAALMSVRIRPLFWLFVIAFNVVGLGDIAIDYVHAVQTHLPLFAGDLGFAYIIPIIYVPILTITHLTALYWLVRREPQMAVY